MSFCQGCAGRVGVGRVDAKGEGAGCEAALVRLARGQGAVDAAQELRRQEVEERGDYKEAVRSPGRQLGRHTLALGVP